MVSEKDKVRKLKRHQNLLIKELVELREDLTKPLEFDKTNYLMLTAFPNKIQG